MIQPVILEKLDKLPESLQTEVLHYIEFLLDKHAVNPTLEEVPKNYHLGGSRNGYGSLAGKIIMSDDFDEPLENLKEYM